MRTSGILDLLFAPRKQRPRPIIAEGGCVAETVGRGKPAGQRIIGGFSCLDIKSDNCGLPLLRLVLTVTVVPIFFLFVLAAFVEILVVSVRVGFPLRVVGDLGVVPGVIVVVVRIIATIADAGGAA